MDKHCRKSVLCTVGIIMIPMVLSLISFDMAASTRLKGGNAYTLWSFQLKLKAFITMQYGSVIQETYLPISLRRLTNKSTSWLNRNLLHKVWKNMWESILSVFSLKTLDILLALVFPTPGMWLEEIQKPLFCANSQWNVITNNRIHASHIVNVC